MNFDLGTLVAHLKVDDQGMDFRGALDKIKGFGNEGGKAAKVAGLAIAAGLTAAVGAAMNVEPARKKLAAQLRLTPAEQATINASADKLFKGNYAEDIGEANDVLRSVISNFKDMRNASSEDLAAMGQKAASTARLMGVEFDTVTRVAGQMVRDGLAQNAEEAFDLITAASQNTAADMQGDLLEVTSEYSKHFATLGISGSEAMKLISDASEDGAISMDKVGDGLKELTIRATDMSTASVEAYQAAGLNAKDMADKILAGGDTARGAFDQIVDGLLGIEDPTARANAAIGLFGTPLEDLGTDKIPAFLTALQGMDDGLGDVTGRAQEAGETMSGSMAGSFSGMVKQVQATAIELGEAILPLLQPIVDVAGEVVGWLGKIGSAFGELPGGVQAGLLALGGIVLIGPKVAAAFRMIRQEMAFASYGMGAFAGGWGKLGKVIAGGAALVGVGLLIGEISAGFQEVKQRQQEVAGVTDSLTQALVANSGAWSEQIRQQQIATIAGTDIFKAMINAGHDYQASLDYLINGTEESKAAIYGNKEAMDNLDPALILHIARLAETGTEAENAAKEQLEFSAAQKTTEKTTKDSTVASEGHKNALQGELQAAIDAAAASAEDAAAVGNAARAKESAADAADRLATATSEYGLAAEVAADQQSELADATGEVLVELDKLAGRFPTYEQAASDMHEAVDDMASSFGVGTEEAEKLDASVQNADGTIRTTTESGRKFRDGLLDVRESMATAAQAAYDKAVADGDLLGAQDAANAAAQRGYDDFIANASAILGSKEAAERAAEAYGLIPSDVSTTVKAVDQATPKIGEIKRKLDEINGRIVTTTVYTNGITTYSTRNVGGGNSSAANSYRWMGGSLRGLANGGTPEGILGIPAPTNPREDNLLGSANGKPFKFRGDEFIMNPRATDTFGPVLEWMNSAVPAFAGGGIPSAGSLMGRSGRTPGSRENIVLGSIADISDVVRELRDTFQDAREELAGSREDYRQARAERDKAVAEGDKQEIARARARVVETKKAYEADRRAADAAKRRRDEVERDWQSTARARAVLVGLSREMDSVAKNLENARDRLASVTSARDSLRGNLRSGIAGFGGGILGYSEQRTTAASILRGMQYNQKEVGEFSRDLIRLRRLGLDSSLIEQIASAGVEGGATTADALSRATKSQIAAINRANSATINNADMGALSTANSVYLKDMNAATKEVRAYAAKLDRLGDIDEKIATAVAKQFKALTNQGLAVLVHKGEKELARR